MSKYKTRPIGEIFEYHKIKLQVVGSNECRNCYFYDISRCNSISKKTGYCGSSVRDDRINVIFKRIDE